MVMIILQVLYVFTFIGKTLLHTYIGNRNNNSIVNSGIASSPQLFWFYTKPVSQDFLLLKRVCNYLHLYNILFWIVVLMVSGIKSN